MTTEQTSGSKLRDELEAAIRKRQDAELRDALAAVETLEKYGVSVTISGKVVHHAGTLKQRKPRKPARKLKHKASKNLAGESLPDAIDRVLTAQNDWLKVTEIAKILQAEGRSFGATRPDTLVSSTIGRRAAALGWINDGHKPRRWRKFKGGQSS